MQRHRARLIVLASGGTEVLRRAGRRRAACSVPSC